MARAECEAAMHVWLGVRASTSAQVIGDIWYAR